MSNFYPRPPRGGRRITDQTYDYVEQFLSTPSARRATADQDHQSGRRSISIHALREEGDGSPPAGCSRPRYFYPRPPRGGRRLRPAERQGADAISIHALREEGDSTTWPKGWPLRNFYPRPPRGGRRLTSGRLLPTSLFLSTPSARRATRHHQPRRLCTPISIHALREEGDRGPGTPHRPLGYFYPRPPRGGRPFASANSPVFSSFLSTPSARRATAKTETKSLFSNKLYNILHEFRRALIYNGSKNYPNHAK